MSFLASCGVNREETSLRIPLPFSSSLRFFSISMIEDWCVMEDESRLKSLTLIEEETAIQRDQKNN